MRDKEGFVVFVAGLGQQRVDENDLGAIRGRFRGCDMRCGLQQNLEAASQELEAQFQANEKSLAEQQEKLRERLGTMGELFGVIRQVAGDTRGHLVNSLVSAELPDRALALERIGKESTTPSMDDLRSLWLSLMEEMKSSGEVSRFQAPVVAPNGEEKIQTVTRVGPFNAVSEGAYLQWMPQVQKLSEKIGQLGEARMILLASLVLLDKSDEVEKEAEKIISIASEKIEKLAKKFSNE